MTYQEENNRLLESFLERTFFRSWKRPRVADNFDRLEIQVTGSCNLTCAYCYMSRHGEELYPAELRDEEVILKHLKAFLAWLAEKGYSPTGVDLFSGELFAQEIGFKVLETMFAHYASVQPESRPQAIVVPTNCTFLLSDDITARVEKYIADFASLGVHLSLSASVDGKYEESNRPGCEGAWLVNAVGTSRDDDYYERLFEFNARHRFGFHPMVYSRGIERWQDNFLWFQDGFKRHGIPPEALYLLEVRNEEWSAGQVAEFAKFIRFLVEWTWEHVGRDVEAMKEFIFRKRGFNILSAPFSRNLRGLGCALQSMLYVRLGDLAIVSCHRTMYRGMEAGRFLVRDGRITGIEANNVEFLIGELTFQGDAAPMCETCLIKPMCAKGCLGSQFESTGDFFSPIPTVCQLEHGKLLGMIEGYKSIGMWSRFLTWIDEGAAYRLRKLEEMAHHE
ncbi:MAG: hypothetical protein AB1563_07520 [Bacillota bacterium]